MTESTVPIVAVVVATKDRPDHFRDLLVALGRQTLPGEQFEVLVADDASGVPLSEFIHTETLPFRFHLVRREVAGGPGVARNSALELMDPAVELVAFTDDDCLPDPEWLEMMLAAYRAYPKNLLGGKLRNAATDFICSEASQVISDLVYMFYNSDPENARFFSTNNVGADASVLRELKNFNDNYGGASEDRDLCDRWRFAGYRMRFVPEATLAHNHRLRLRKFLRQHFNYGKGAAVFHSQRTLRKSGRMLEEMSFHRRLPVLVKQRLKGEPFHKVVRLVSLLILWQAANAAGYFYGRLRPDARPTDQI